MHLSKAKSTSPDGTLKSAVKANPRQPNALKSWPDRHSTGPDWTSLGESLKRLTRLDPFDPEARYSYAQALKLAGDLERTTVELKHAARLRKENHEIVELRQALLRDPNNLNACFRISKWLLDHGHQDEGLSWTKEIFRRDPDHAPTHRLLAEYYDKKGDAGLANYHRVTADANRENGR